MKALDPSLILAKNTLNSNAPFIYLLVLEVDDSTTARWAVYQEDVVFDGQTYTAIPGEVEVIRETNQGRFEGLTVHVSNAMQQVSAYLAATQLLGRDVTVRMVNAALLSVTAAAMDYSYRIDAISVTDEVATFTLGRENLYARQLPQQRFIRNRCRFRFRDTNCGYPGDEFKKSTKQDLKDTRTTGSPFQKLQGWYALNAHLCAYARVAMSSAIEYLDIYNVASTVAQWWNTEQSSIYVFKVFTGDFDFYYYQLGTTFTDNDRWGGCIIQSSISPNDWIAATFERIAGVNSFRVLSTVSGVTSQLATTSNLWQYVRFVRAGDAWTIYHKQYSSSAWTTLHTFTRTLSDPVRIGFSHGARSTSTPYGFTAWDYLRFTSGGLTTCDMTLDGPNGCRAHCNTLRYGGAPAIPRGRIM